MLDVIQDKHSVMKFYPWFKSIWTDKRNTPIRNILMDHVSLGCSLLDVACGTGIFLIRSASKINYGVGIDIDSSMIEFANNRRNKHKNHNLTFVVDDALLCNLEKFIKFDIATCCLFCHELSTNSSIFLLKKLSNASSRILVADYDVSGNSLLFFKFLFDELINGTLSRYINYVRLGGIKFIARKANLEIVKLVESPIKGINIWILK